MTTITHTAAAGRPQFSRLSTLFGNLRTRFQKYRMYRQTFSALAGLSDRELTDLGLTRSMIGRVSREAVYDL